MFARNKKGALIREPGGLLSTAVGAQVLDYWPSRSGRYWSSPL